MSGFQEGAEDKYPPYYVDIASGDILLGNRAYELKIDSGSHPADLIDLQTVLLDASVPLPEIADRISGETREEVLEQGRFILKLLNAGNSAKGLRQRIVRRAHALGLIANDHHIASPDMFGSFRGLQRELGLEDIDKRYDFEDYTLDDILDHLQAVAQEEDRKPTKDILWRRIRVDKKEEITPRMIHDRITLSEALELIGYPNIKNKWRDPDYVQWGVDYILANRMRLPDRTVIDELSRKGYGPSTAGIILQFGKVNHYKDLIQQRLEEIMDAIGSGLNGGQIPPELFAGASSIQEIVPRYLTYEFVKDILPLSDDWLRVQISAAQHKGAGFISALRRQRPGTTAEFIQSESRRHQCFYYIFPRVDRMDSLDRGPRRISPQARMQNRARREENLRAQRRLLRKAAKVQQTFVGKVRVLETTKLDNGYIVKKLAPEWSERPHSPDSSRARQIVATAAEEEDAKTGKRKFTIRRSSQSSRQYTADAGDLEH